MSESENMVAVGDRFRERDLLIDTQEYRQLVNNISLLWDKAKEKAVLAVNSELLDANVAKGSVGLISPICVNFIWPSQNVRHCLTN